MNKEQVLEAIKGTQFEADLGKALNVNGAQASRGWWNLICSVRDVNLFCKGIKPTRGWRFTDVKWYFGVSGNKQKVAKTLEAYRDALFPKED